MAAFMRLSRLSSGFKCSAVLLVNKEIISRNTCFVKEASCRFFGSLPNRLNNYIKFGDYNQRLYSISTATASTSANQNVRSARPPKSSEIESPLHIQLQELDIQVRRTGRIDSDQVDKLLKAMTGTLSNHEAVMLVKCTGSLLVKESPEERNEIFEKMWNKILSSGFKMNIQVYNAMLRTKLENNQTFSPVEVLADLENVKQLVPNKMTYRLLVAQFCETGDIEGASKILDHMKSQKLPIDENVFNALLKGHMRRGERTAAEDVLASMKDYGIEPSGNTYETYMSCLAEKGDVAGVKQILSGADVVFSAQNIYHVIQTFVQSGHEDKIDFLLEYIEGKDHPKHNHDALNCVFQLVASGHDDAAFEVYKSMDRTDVTDDRRDMLGKSLLRCMIVKRRPVDKVFENFEKLDALKIAGDKEGIVILAMVYAANDIEYMMKLFQRMKKEGMPLEDRYFWPIFRGANKRNDIEGMYSVVRCYGENIDRRTAFWDTMIPWTKNLQKTGETLDKIFAQFKDYGFPEEEITTLKTVVLISNGCFDEAEKLFGDLFKKGPINSFIRETVNGFYKKKQDVPMLLKFTKSMSRMWRDPCYVNTGVLLNSLNHGEASTGVAVELVNAWEESDMKIKFSAEKSIKQLLKDLKVPESTIDKVNNFMIDSGDEDNSFKIQDLKRLESESLEPTLENVKYENSPFANVVKRIALTKFCLNGMVEKADALKKLLDSQGFIYNFGNLKGLGIMAARDNGNLEEALEYLHQLELKFPNHENYAHLILQISNLYVKADKFNDAVDLLKSYRSKHMLDLDYQLSDPCRQLVQSCAESIGSKEANEIMNLLFELGYVKKGSFDVLNEMMSGCLKNSDTEEAVSNFEECVAQYQRAPFFTNLFINLIEKEDAERLQRVVDQATTVFGETDTLIHLLACFVECGKLKQARKIVATPGLKASKKPLNDACKRFFIKQKEKEFEQLVEVTKNLPGIDRDEMLFQLIRYHSNKSKNSQKMLDVLSMYGEEGIFPRTRTLRYIAKVLESRNEPIPFNVPPLSNTTEIKESKPTKTKEFEPAKTKESKPAKTKESKLAKTGKVNVIDSELDEEVKKSIQFKSVEDLMQMKKHLDAEGSAEKSTTFVVNVVKFLLHRNESEKLRSFIHVLGVDGCVDILLTLQKYSFPNKWNTFICQQLCRAYIQTNNANEFVDQFKDKPNELMTSMTLDNLKEMSNKNPTVFATMETLITKKESSDKGSRFALKNLYYFYLLGGQYERAGQILEKNLYLKKEVDKKFICRWAVKEKKAEVVRYLIKLHQLDNPRQLQAPFSSLLLIECDQGDWNSAMKVYEEAMSKGLAFNDFWTRPLQTFNSLLLENSQPIPWQPGMLEKKIAQIAERKQRKDASSSSSSSDSSDSDQEQKRV